MKKTALFLAIVLMIALLGVVAFADSGVKVTVSIANGELVLTEKVITVYDLDGDNVITVKEALITAHKECHPDGESAFGYANTDYGVSITKLWGIDNGGGYGYYVNNASAMSLSDEIKAGDRIYAYLYTDTVNYSDMYAYFDCSVYDNVPLGTKINLKLLSAGYDENWAPVTLPVAGAEIVINGEKTGVFTDSEGNATVQIFYMENIITAVSDELNLVPPVCIANGFEEMMLPPQTGDSGVVALTLISFVSAVAVVVVKKTRA